MRATMEVKFTKNSYNTVFVYVDGVQIAQSVVLGRYRGLYNSRTKVSVPGRHLTPRKVKAAPESMIAALAQSGTVLTDYTLNVCF